MVLENVLISFFTWSCPVFPAQLIEETVFSPLYILPLLSQIDRKCFVGLFGGSPFNFFYQWVCFLMRVSLCCICFVLSQENGKCKLPSLIFFFKFVLASQGSLEIPYECWDQLVYFFPMAFLGFQRNPMECVDCLKYYRYLNSTLSITVRCLHIDLIFL